ncbi:MAG: poly-beta-1,6-N-acetyl-D-glucosamine N-deacetylase PgaB [Desulfobacca sp.]|nr:poly-beta-1,6-N-acetyl-D-glucosamine N-deacetylase PgaB [Desulfobacca sp.]
MSWERILLSANIFKGLALFLALAWLSTAPASAGDTFIALTYHDIPVEEWVGDDISQSQFVKQLEFFKTHGFTFISPQDLLAAAQGHAPLPNKALLLTFDDAYESFYTFVYPVLQLYKIPVVLSVVTSWIDNPQAAIYKTKKLMSWEQLREVGASRLVTIASHSHALHQHILANPAGNVEPAPETFQYFPEAQRYETEAEFRTRLRTDLAESIALLRSKVGGNPYILTWPYGAYNELGLQEAARLGFKIVLTLESGLAQVRDLLRVKRLYMLPHRYWAPLFKEGLARQFKDNLPMRAAQVDLDAIIEPGSYAESDHNLGLLIERLVALGVNTVFIQGFVDQEGSGNISALYFPNRVLPVEMDFLSHAVNRLRVRNIKVFVWMPVLSYELPDPRLNDQLKVREYKDGQLSITTSWYRRLSPFAPQTLEIVGKIFQDLAIHVNFDGILFQDDAYLNDFEDFHPAALEVFAQRSGWQIQPGLVEGEPWRGPWFDCKTEVLNEFINQLTNIVRRYRPQIQVARNIYSEPVLNPSAQEWFAQNFASYLASYDYTVIMAYANMEKVKNKSSWYAQLVERARNFGALDRVVFKVQAFDWQQKTWLKSPNITQDLRYLVSQGARHIAYYPDDVYLDKPEIDQLSPMISGREDLPEK